MSFPSDLDCISHEIRGRVAISNDVGPQLFWRILFDIKNMRAQASYSYAIPSCPNVLRTSASTFCSQSF